MQSNYSYTRKQLFLLEKNKLDLIELNPLHPAYSTVQMLYQLSHDHQSSSARQVKYIQR